MNDVALAQIEQARRYAAQLGNLVHPGGTYAPILAGLLNCLERAKQEIVKPSTEADGFVEA